ncbi:MAG: hypothetical protein LVQ64_04620 [Thermoplasmatales archaeon]|nr:hypothetical protein [Thermoplasmatales archaeon]
MARAASHLQLSALENETVDLERLRAGVMTIRTAVLTDRALSVGVGVRPNDPMLRKAQAFGVPVVRRSSGGTGVLHAPGDVAWRSRGIPAAWVPSPGRSECCCFLGYRGRSLTVHGRVVGGAAQHLTGRALLHHGVLPRTVDRAAHAALFGLGDEELEGLAGTDDLGIDAPAEELAAELRERILDSFALERQEGELGR